MSSLTLSKEEEKRLKGLGFLNNKGTDNFSARILTVNGKVTAAQHRAMADAAETFGNGILTFTTRQTVEVHRGSRVRDSRAVVGDQPSWLAANSWAAMARRLASRRSVITWRTDSDSSLDSTHLSTRSMKARSASGEGHR